MDGEDESTAYLKYLNDPTTPNNYPLSNGVELVDQFPFAEIETTDWPPEGFPVLLSSPLITEECNNTTTATEDIQLFSEEATIIHTNGDKEEIELAPTPETDELSSENSYSSYLPIQEQNDEEDQDLCKKTYINYAPIVKENPDGNKEIYLTEKDINNDASIIQLFNTDGSIITIDKSILSSLNLPKQTDVAEKVPERKYEDYFSTVTANKCKVCSFLCETEEEIKNHLNDNHEDLFLQQSLPVKPNGSMSILKNNKEGKEYTIFLCSICKIACSDKVELKEHMINNHKLMASSSELKLVEKTVMKIGESNEKKEKTPLNSISSFLIKQQEKARKKVKCLVKGCNLRFAKDELRQRHEECHVGENKKQFKCTQCKETFSIWRICSDHLWKCHKIDLGLITCPMCNNFKSNSSIRVLNHMAIHNEEKPFLCKDCGKGYKTMVQLKNHEVIHKNPEDVPNWYVMRQCDICERYFANSKCLKKHIQSVHEHFKPFICNICGHKTARKAMLELHLRQHTGAKPHECPYCEYRTGDHNCLRKHIMRHIGARKYLCPYCPYTSIQSASYKSHINNRHPGKSGTYSCNYCSYTCINLANYSAHLKRHEAALKDSSSTEVTTEQAEMVKQQANGHVYVVDIEDETQTCFLNSDQVMEETVDRGGITIPAGFEMQLVSS